MRSPPTHSSVHQYAYKHTHTHSHAFVKLTELFYDHKMSSSITVLFVPCYTLPSSFRLNSKNEGCYVYNTIHTTLTFISNSIENQNRFVPITSSIPYNSIRYNILQQSMYRLFHSNKRWLTMCLSFSLRLKFFRSTFVMLRLRALCVRAISEL